MDFSGEAVGYIMVYINEQLFEEKIFAGVAFGPSSNIMLVNAHGDVLSSQDRSFLGQNIADSRLFQEIRTSTTAGQSTFNLEHQIAVAVYNKDFDCYLIANIPESYITEETRSINTVLFWIAAALIFLSLLLTFVVYVSIVSPIRNIISACNITSDEELNVHINDQNQDELGFLARTIDRMMDEILLLMARRREDQIRRRELELKNLQYQINPHFLFNTLNSLQWVATINDVPAVAEGLSSLSALLRNTIIENGRIHSTLGRSGKPFSLFCDSEDTLWKFLRRMLAARGGNQYAPSAALYPPASRGKRGHPRHGKHVGGYRNHRQQQPG